MNSIWIGFDSREASAFAVARHSINKYLTQLIPVRGLVLEELQAKGLYTRPMEWRKSAADKPIMWDVISDAPMSTQHANARFLVPHLAKKGWALFCDGDIQAREGGNLVRMFEGLDSSKAVYCVKHKHEPAAAVKMDAQIQTAYHRKNWTSFIAFNCYHEANRALTLEMVNTLPGRDLHRLCWIEDDNLIGELGPEWNHLVGVNPPNSKAKIAHFTLGVPDMPGYKDCEFADEWRNELNSWAR